MLQRTISELDQHRITLMEQLEKKSELLSTADDQLDEKVSTHNSKIISHEQRSKTLRQISIVSYIQHILLFIF